MKKIIFISAILTASILSSCKKDRFFEEHVNPQNMEDLTVPSGFDWKTTKDILLTLTAPNAGIVEVSNAQKIPYQKAFLSPGTAYSMKLTVPSYEQSVRLKFDGQESSLELSTTELSFSF